jgi:hypothetical protein
MAYTGAGKNISGQFGMPLYGIQGTLPPFTGNAFWVDASVGSDGNTGGPGDPVATLTQALTLATAGNNDVIYLNGTINPTAAVAWSKNNTHLVGLGLPSNIPNATITVANAAATTGAFTPLVNVTASGCIFQNINAVSGIAQAATQVCWAEAGGSNYYNGCTFNGNGALVASAQAGNRSLTIASAGNTFVDCVIGGDVILRATGNNFNIGYLAGAGSNTFEACQIVAYTSNTAAGFITAPASAMPGYQVFLNCQFIQDVTNTSGVTMAAGIIWAATTGTVLITPTTIFQGVTAIATTGNVYFVGVNPGGANSATTGNIAILAT